MPQTTGDRLDPAWKRPPVAMEEKDPDPGEECDMLPVLKLQAPPKSKCKRQLPSDSHPQPAVGGRPDHFVPVVKGPCLDIWKFSHSPTDTTHRVPARDFLQLHEASFTFPHSSPSLTSSPFASNFSPKKFRSQYGPIPSPSRTYEAVVSPRNAPSLPINLHQICRCITENGLADSPSTSCRSPFAKVPANPFKDSQHAALHEQTEVRKSLGHPATRYFNNKPSRCRSAQNLAFEDTHLRTRPTVESHGMTRAGLPDTHRPEPTWTSHTHNNQPDVFVFPECVIREAASSQQGRRRLNTRETDEVFPDCKIDASNCSQQGQRRMNTRETDEVFPDCKIDESNCSEQDQRRMNTRERDTVFPDCKIDESNCSQQDQRRMNTQERDTVFPDCKIEESSGSHQAANRINKDKTDEPDGLDSPMDTDDYSFQSSYRKLTPKQNMLPTIRPQDSFSTNVPLYMNHPSTLQCPVNESCTLEYDKHHERPRTLARDTHPVRVHKDIPSEKDIVYGNRTSAQLNRMPYEHFPRTVYEQRRHEPQVFQREPSAWGPNSSAAEILDTSESDDISQYLEDHESMLGEWTGTAQRVTTKPDSNNNRIPKNYLGRREIAPPEDDYPVKTTADTNVCYISLSDIRSSTSSDDMEYDYEDQDPRAYIGHMPQFYDFGDEPDGKDKKLAGGENSDEVAADQGCKFLVVSNAGPLKLGKDHSPVSDCHQPAKYLREDHPLGVSLPGKPQLILAHKESVCHEKISFIVEDSCRTANKTADDATSSPSPESDGCTQNARSTHGNQQEHHYHHPNRSKNMKPLFHELSKHEVALFNTVERKHVVGVTCRDSQTWHHYAYNNNNNGCSINNGQFADEVDGLGDKKKGPHHTQRADSQTESPKQSNEVKVVHCFDTTNPGSDTSTTAQSTAASVNTVPDGTNTSHDLPAARSIFQEKHPASPVVNAEPFSAPEMAEPLKKAPESTGSSLKRTNTDTNTPQRTVQGYSRHPDMYREMREHESNRKQSNTGQEHTAVCQSPNVQPRRRKSDTSVGDVTESGLSRSQSSPSKLGVPEDISSNRKPVSFHRPWLDQQITQQKTLIPAATPGPRINSSSLSPVITSGPHVSSALSRRAIAPTEYTSSSSKKPFGSDKSRDETTGNRVNLFSDKSVRNTRTSEDDMLISSQDLLSGASAAPRTSLHQHHKRRTERRSKRKLELSMQESRDLQPTAQRPARQVIPLPSKQNQREPGGIDTEHLPQEHEANSGQVKGTTASWQEDVSPSTSLSRPQGEESRPSPRHDDEVDIRVEVTDVFQESTRLKHRLERIYQADDRSCACSRIEQSILRSALDMFRALGNEASSREYWMDQLNQTNDVIRKTLDLAENFRRLCRHGRQVTDVFPGSIVIRIKCRTVLSLVDLCELHASGDLHKILFNILSQSAALDKPGLALAVTLDRSNVVTCQGYLLTRMDKDVTTRSGTREQMRNKMAPMRGVSSADNLLYSFSEAGSPCGHAAAGLCRSPPASLSHHTPSGAFSSQRERKFSFGEINRTAFQELNISGVASPTSPSFGRLRRDDTCQLPGKPDLILAPSVRLNSPNVLNSPKLLTSPGSSPLTSPRKLNVCDVISEQENIDHNKD